MRMRILFLEGVFFVRWMVFLLGMTFMCSCEKSWYIEEEIEEVEKIEDYLLTGLPVVYITTSNPVESKDMYEKAVVSIKSSENYILEESSAYIRGRGNATWTYPKKPYKIEFDERVEIFGFPADKEYALLSNYTDKSLTRCAIGFRVAEILGMDWTPRNVYVEVVLNGKHLGNYQLVESVKKSPTRVNIDDAGFILEYSHYDHEEFDIESKILSGFVWHFKYPKRPNAMTIEKVRKIIEPFEEACKLGRWLHVNSMINEQTFVKWYYARLLLNNLDTNYYVYCNSDGKLSLGPVWDFEWSIGTGIPLEERPMDPRTTSEFFCFNIQRNSVFRSEVKKIHEQYSEVLRSQILVYYDWLGAYLKSSADVNFQLWPILNQTVPGSVGALPLGSWRAEMDCDISFFKGRMDYLDSLISGW